MKIILKNGFGFLIVLTALGITGCKKNDRLPASKEIQLTSNATLGNISISFKMRHVVF